MKKFSKFYLIFIISLSTFGFLLYLIARTGFFDPEIISEKYCYFYNEKYIDKHNPVLATNDIDDAKRIFNYYQVSINPDLKDTIIYFDIPNSAYYIPKFLKVKIIGYNADSSIVKIWAKWKEKYHGGFYREEKGYIPGFTLHDTLPAAVK